MNYHDLDMNSKTELASQVLQGGQSGWFINLSSESITLLFSFIDLGLSVPSEICVGLI